MNELILHVGFPKCGSSYLQSFLAKNTDHLLRQGIVYPEIFDLTPMRKGVYGQGNGYSLAYYLLDDKTITNCQYEPFTLNDLSVLLSKTSGKVLISSEWFVVISNENLKALRDTAKKNNYEVKVVFYIRPVLDFLESEYAQNIKMGKLSVEFDEWNYNISFHHIVNKLRSAFGVESVHARLYDKSSWKGGRLSIDFLDFIGVNDIKLFEDVGGVNESLSPLVLYLQRKLNHTGNNFSEKELLVLQEFIDEKTVFNSSANGRWMSEDVLNKARDRALIVKELSEQLFADNPCALMSFSKENKSCYETMGIPHKARAFVDFIKQERPKGIPEEITSKLIGLL